MIVAYSLVYFLMSTFLNAVRRNALEEVQKLIDQGADIHANEEEALKAAAVSGFWDLVRLLIETGAEINTNDGIILDFAAIYGNEMAVHYLLAHGAESHSAFHRAVLFQSFEVVRLLVSRGARIETDYVIEAFEKRGNERHLEMVHLLLDLGANENGSVLLQASKVGEFELVRILISRRDSLSHINEALRIAATNDRVEVAQILIDNGADVNEVGGTNDDNEYHTTPLIAACASGSIQIVQLLIIRGADIHAHNEKALIEAATNGYLPIVQLLLGNEVNNIAERVAFDCAAFINDIEMMEFILDRNANIIHTWGNLALIRAVSSDQLETTRLLLQRGANINGITQEILTTALARGGISFELSELLLEHGVLPAPEVLHTSFSSDSAYHGFFLTFCEHSGRSENAIHLKRFREIMHRAASATPPLVDITPVEAEIIRTGTQRTLCSWMQRKQDQRSQVCRSENQYDREPFSQEPVNTIPLLFLWITTPIPTPDNSTPKRNCFDLISLERYLAAGQRRNPLNGEDFTEAQVDEITERTHVLYDLMHSVFAMIQ